MKELVNQGLLPSDAVLVTCSSHEDRCRGFLLKMGAWRPQAAVLFHYDDSNDRRERNHEEMRAGLVASHVPTTDLLFTEKSAVKSLRDNMAALRRLLRLETRASIVLDISVFTKRHLLMVLRWLDDEEAWDRVTIVYSEPNEYDVSTYTPLSFGLSTFQEIPGFTACADVSRPVHLVLFLGYEGDRALAAYENVEPIQATLVISHPPFKSEWLGRVEQLNRELLAVMGNQEPVYVDPIDPSATRRALNVVFSDAGKLGAFAKIICPLGTKPQTVGVYSYLRTAPDPPALVYASPLRHNHTFYSHGIGRTWVLKQGTQE
jgi:hypothetical protein